MKVLTIFVLLIALTGCVTDPIEVTTKAVKKAPITLPSVDEYNHRNVTWIILTPENVEKEFVKLAKKGKSIAIFGLSADGYEALALNGSDIRKLVQQLQAQVGAYKKYYIVVPKTPKKK